MDNLPNDPSNQNNNPPPSQTPSPPHPTHSDIAKHRQRDIQGHFLPYEHPNQNSPNPSILPPIIEVNQNTQPSSKKDPPLFGIFMTNPVTYLRIFLDKLIKRQAITIKIPVLAILMAAVATGSFGAGFHWGLNQAASKFFPNYSPLLHRSITQQGIIQQSTKGEYFLKADDKKKTMWSLKSISANVKLADFVNRKVQIKGNLTPTPNLIEVSEVISF